MWKPTEELDSKGNEERETNSRGVTTGPKWPYYKNRPQINYVFPPQSFINSVILLGLSGAH
jgi:hypothetical protein